jgi:hypothetical protein
MESPVSAQEQISLFPQEDRTKTANTAAYTIIFLNSTKFIVKKQKRYLRD